MNASLIILQSDPNIIWLDCNVENLIYLKSIIEKQVASLYHEIDFETRYYVAYISDNPTIYYIFAKYNENIEKTNIDEFMISQKTLLQEVYSCLAINCQHKWISDNYNSKNLVNLYYCSHCNIKRYTFLKIT